jgi:hypothetical protein
MNNLIYAFLQHFLAAANIHEIFEMKFTSAKIKYSCIFAPI